MALSKKLWLVIIVLMTLVFAGACALTNLSAKARLEQQLALNNTNSAGLLALFLQQQLTPGAPLELSLPAKLDTHSYELIQATDAQGEVSVLHANERHTNGAPGWFIDLFRLNIAPGVASIRKDGQQLGTLTVSGGATIAYSTLWQGTQQLAILFLIAALTAGALGSYLLQRSLRPLGDLVDQAEAIGSKRFAMLPEPTSADLKPVVAAMNTLSSRVKSMLSQEAVRPQKKQPESHVDKISGLLDRDRFRHELAAELKHSDGGSHGSVAIIRLGNLAHINQVYGRKSADGMLSEIGRGLKRLSMQNSGWGASRLNGSDFVVLAPHTDDPAAVARQAQEVLIEVLVNRSMNTHIPLPGATTAYNQGETIGDILTRLDGALMAAVAEGESAINVARRGDVQVMPVRQQLDKWRDIFRQAFVEHKFSLTAYPVAGLEGDLLHLESPVRLQWQDESLTASQFLPWINRLELASDLDKQVVDLALSRIEAERKPICINLSVAAVADASFLMWISEKLSTHEPAAGMLWMEVQEAMAYRYLENFKKLCIRAQGHGTKMGIEHAGHQLADIGQLQDVKLDYLKIDGTFARDIDQNPANQTLVRTLCTIGKSMGIAMIAEGVNNATEWDTLKELGVDGVTGPGVRIDSEEDHSALVQ